jgi:Fe-S oxidoreductase
MNGQAGLKRMLKGLKRPFLSLGKKTLHATLLRFPGGDSHDPIACTYCPEMCRFACPTAVSSGNDAVTPCNKMSLLHKEERWPGRAAAGGPLWPLYDCTGCGRCTEFCVYEVPVGPTLFAARARYAWEPARKAAAQVGDASDPVGDLAEELGDEAAAKRRLAAYLAARAGQPLVADEPRSVQFLASRGHAASLSWQKALDQESVELARVALKGRAWLVHESVWLSRRLGRAPEIAAWVERVRAAGVELVLPFHHGKDCIDSGGEGAYPRLFESQARQMARDVWERDRHRAQGLLCFSRRGAEHLRASLGPDVPVVSVPELFVQKSGGGV